jgi:hypothetical protein
MKGTINLLPQLSALIAIQLDRRAGQAPMGPMDDRHHHPQIARQFGHGRRRWPEITLPLSFQEQLRLIENAQPDRRRSVSPGGVQLSGFAAGEPMRRKRFGHALTVFEAHTCHRYQKLHGHVGRDRTAADLSLHALGKLIDQRQTARYPTRAAIEAARQLVESIAKALLQFGQQPAFFQRRLMFRPAQRTVQDQSFGLAHRPDHSLHRVPAQLLQRRYPLVAVDHQVTVNLAGNRHHHNRRLLPRGGQRRQQPPLSLRPANPQMFPAPIQLMKLKLHRPAPQPFPQLSLPHPRSGLFRARGEVCPELSWNQYDKP